MHWQQLQDHDIIFKLQTIYLLLFSSRQDALGRFHKAQTSVRHTEFERKVVTAVISNLNFRATISRNRLLQLQNFRGDTKCLAHSFHLIMQHSKTEQLLTYTQQKAHTHTQKKLFNYVFVVPKKHTTHTHTINHSFRTQN